MLLLCNEQTQPLWPQISFSFQVRRAANPQDFFRGNTNPEDGGKAPESGLLRVEINKIDSLGIQDPRAQRISAALVNTPLPDRVDPHGYSDHPYADPTGYGGYHPSGSTTTKKVKRKVKKVPRKTKTKTQSASESAGKPRKQFRALEDEDSPPQALDRNDRAKNKFSLYRVCQKSLNGLSRPYLRRL
jgi:hypothetical protein